MESISVFDIIKVGIGPSSSHTMGPWKAAEMFLNAYEADLKDANSITIYLYGIYTFAPLRSIYRIAFI